MVAAIVKLRSPERDLGLPVVTSQDFHSLFASKTLLELDLASFLLNFGHIFLLEMGFDFISSRPARV